MCAKRSSQTGKHDTVPIYRHRYTEQLWQFAGPAPRLTPNAILAVNPRS